MLITREELWEQLEPIVSSSNLKLFDIDFPESPTGTLRVYIWRGQEDSEGINLDDCAAVSRKLSRLEAVESLLGETRVLEVSSPGVNRRLRLPEHFQTAIGERIKVRFKEEGSTKVAHGELKEFNGTSLILHDEEAKKDLNVSLDSVKDAQVDFVF